MGRREEGINFESCKDNTKKTETKEKATAKRKTRTATKDFTKDKSPTCFMSSSLAAFTIHRVFVNRFFCFRYFVAHILNMATAALCAAWVICAGEGEICECPSNKVRFGMDPFYIEATITGGSEQCQWFKLLLSFLFCTGPPQKWGGGGPRGPGWPK